MKGKTLRKHSLCGKTAASVLLKLFISGNATCTQKTHVPPSVAFFRRTKKQKGEEHHQM